MRVRFLAAAAIVVLAAAATTLGQFAPPPSMIGVWSPVIGSGSVYEIDSREKKRGPAKMQMEIALVGEEMFEGKKGYWMEHTTQDPTHGPVVSKVLMVMEGNTPGIKRLILKMGDKAMEMPMDFSKMSPQQQKPMNPDARNDSVRVGTETITTPAGTFECEHWRSKDQATDMWLSEKVVPWRLVKMTGKETDMLLIRVIHDAKTKITGPVTRFDPGEMMRQQQKPPQP
jgi:hypothetical protein